jgi:ABC-type multidrug transport system ATPase subunit
MSWMPLHQVLDEPLAGLDPHMHRFTAKLLDAIGTMTAPGGFPCA